MRVFKTKVFARFARKEGIADESLVEAVKRAGKGLIDADLGGGVIKQRVPRAGQGKSGGYRTLLAFKVKERAVFIYGFAKSERANVGTAELETIRAFAEATLAADATALSRALNDGTLIEVKHDDEI